MRFDDDGSHFHQPIAPFGRCGRGLKVKMDGLEVDSVWGGSMTKTTSDGVQVGETLRPYIFAPIDTTGLSTTSSPY